MDLARSIQEVTEEVMLRLSRTMHRETGVDHRQGMVSARAKPEPLSLLERVSLFAKTRSTNQHETTNVL
jgi:hypothetical protein